MNDDNNTDAEQAVLGSLLIDPSAIGAIADTLLPDDFWLPIHGVIYAAVLELHHAGKPGDLVMLSDALQTQGRSDDTGGPAYLASLAGIMPSAANIVHYARIVQTLSKLRQARAAGERLMRATVATFEADLATLHDTVSAIERRATGRTWQALPDLIDENEKMLLGEIADTSRVPTGLNALDIFKSVLKRGKMTVLAARTSVGKTSFATTVAHYVTYAGMHVGVFSVEMDPQDILNKVLSIQLHMDFTHLTEGTKTAQERQCIKDADARLKTLDIDIVPATGWTVKQIAAAARVMATRRPLDLIVVDYLQILHNDEKAQSRYLDVGSNSVALREIGKAENCAMLVLSQLRRPTPGFMGKPAPVTLPQLSDLRESGSIEQDADAVVFLSPPEGAEMRDWMQATVKPVVVYAAKNRLGSTGLVTLDFHGPRMEFLGYRRDTRFDAMPTSGKDKAVPTDDGEDF